MVWQKIDDQFGVSKKVIRIPKSKRHQCVGLWLLAANYSVRVSGNGILEAHELDELDARKTDIAELVRVQLFHSKGHLCERCEQPESGGITIHDFLEYNPDAASVAAVKEQKVNGGKHGNHLRWHVGRQIEVPGCEFCIASASHNRSHMRSPSDSHANPPGSESSRSRPVPGPDPKTDKKEFQKSVTQGDAPDSDETEFIRSETQKLGIKNLQRVRAALERAAGPLPSDAYAIDIARSILDLATTHVRSVEAYIEAAASNSPDEIVQQAKDLGIG